MIKRIIRHSANLKSEIAKALETVLDTEIYTPDSDGKYIQDMRDGGLYPVYYYRNEEEVIAVLDFYIGEVNHSVRGSRGNWYLLNDDILTPDFES